MNPIYCKDIKDDISLAKFNSSLSMLEQTIGFYFTDLQSGLRTDTDMLIIPYQNSAFSRSRKKSMPLSPGDLAVVPKDIELRISREPSLLAICGEGIYDGLSVVKADSIEKEPGVGGQRKMLKGFNRAGLLDVHLIWVDDENKKMPHYHSKLVEVYFTLEGRGRLYVEPHIEGKFTKQTYLTLEPRTLVAVPTGHSHQAVHDDGENMIIQVIGFPKFYRDDVRKI